MLEQSSSVFPNKDRFDKIRVVLAHTNCLVLDALKMLWIGPQQDLEIVAEAGDGEEAMEIAMRLQPDVLVIEEEMPVIGGLEAAKRIVERCPDTKVLILTYNEESTHLLDILHSGASGCIRNSAPGHMFLHAIRSIAAGKKAFHVKILNEILKEESINSDRMLPGKWEGFTNRESEILKLLAKGKSNKDIASSLNTSVHNIKANLSNIFLKLGASSRTEAVSIGIKNRLISLDDLNSL